MNQKQGFAVIAVALTILVILVIGGASYYIVSKNTPISAHQDQASSENNFPPPNVQVATQSQEAFQLPDIYKEGYYHTQDWKIIAEAKPFECVEYQRMVPGEQGSSRKVINGSTYCIRIGGDGAAAGTSYEDRAYSREMNGKFITMSFSLGMVNCGNYDEPRTSDCRNEESKLLNTIDARIDQSFNELKNQEVISGYGAIVSSKPLASGWELEVNLLTQNPKWQAGGMSNEPFLIDENPQMRTFTITPSTKAYFCASPTSPAELLKHFQTESDLNYNSHPVAVFESVSGNVVSFNSSCVP